MLSDESLDVLYICIPPFAHSGELEAAAQKGLHIFIEKPIAIDILRAESMTKAVKKAGIYSRVGYHMRNGAAVKVLKRMIEDGEAGTPTLFDARYDCNSLHSSWWRDRNKSGGQVFEQAIHTYDMAMHFLGKPDVVSGFLNNLCHKGVPGYTVEDTSSSTVRFNSGALGSIAASNCAVPFEWNNRFTIVCEKVTVNFDNPNRAEFIHTSGSEVKRTIINNECDLYLKETEEFSEVIRGLADESCTIVDGLNSLYLVDAVCKSSEANGQVIPVKHFEG